VTYRTGPALGAASSWVSEQAVRETSGDRMQMRQGVSGRGAQCAAQMTAEDVFLVREPQGDRPFSFCFNPSDIRDW
jgi:hypothetical protein